VNFTGVSGPKQTSSSGVFQIQHFNALAWSATEGAVAYNIYRDNVYLATTSSLSYTDLDINWKKGYYYSLRAVDAAGNVGSSTIPVYVSYK